MHQWRVESVGEFSEYMEGGYLIRYVVGGKLYYLEDILLTGQVVWTAKGEEGFWFGSVSEAHKFIEDELEGRSVEVVSDLYGGMS